MNAPLIMSHTGAPVDIADIWLHDSHYWQTMSRVTPRHGYELYTNPVLVSRYDPNHAGYIRCISHTTANVAIRDIVAFFDALGFDSVVYLDHAATPDTLPTLLSTHGFRAMTEWGIVDLLVLDRFHAPAPHARIQVTRVADAADVHTWALLDEPTPHSPAEIMYALRREEVSHPDVCGYLAWIDGVAAGRCLTYTEGGITRVESVFVAENLRRQGVARRLVAQAVADAMAHSRIVYLFALHDSYAQTLYYSLGLQTVVHNAVTTYVRPFSDE